MPQQTKCLLFFHTRINILNKLNLKCNKMRHCNVKMIEVKVSGALRLFKHIQSVKNGILGMR